MDETASNRARDPLSAREPAAENIRRYLDDHRSGSPRAISVVMQVAAGSADRKHAGPASDGPADAAVRRAIDRLRRGRAPKTP